MAAEGDQTRRLRDLLTDTIVLLCKKGVHFDDEISIEALVGVTVDRKNVILVSIRETVTVPTELRADTAAGRWGVESKKVSDGKEDGRKIKKRKAQPDKDSDRILQKAIELKNQTSGNKLSWKKQKTSPEPDNEADRQPVSQDDDDECDRGNVANEKKDCGNGTRYPGYVDASGGSSGAGWEDGQSAYYNYLMDPAVLEPDVIKVEEEGVERDDDFGETSSVDEENKTNDDQLSCCCDDYATVDSHQHSSLTFNDLDVTPARRARVAAAAGDVPRRRPGRRGSGSLSVCITAVPEGTTSIKHLSPSALDSMKLGVPACEITASGTRVPSKLPLDWSETQLERHLLRLFPTVETFRLCRCLKNKELVKIDGCLDPANLRRALGRSQLYVVPLSMKATDDFDVSVNE